jgi:uncharacterized protein
MHKQLLRRDALRALAYAGAGFALPLQAAANSKGIFLGGGRYQESPQGEAKFVACKVNLQATGQLEVKNIPTTFFPHGFAVDPTNKQRVIAFEKIGAGACEINIGAEKITRNLATSANRFFYGHGVFTLDGTQLFSTETSPTTGEGFIGLRDGKTLAYLGDFPSYGSHPHDCCLTNDGKVLVVTNGGDAAGGSRKPNLSYIDINSRKLLEQLPIKDDAFNAGHVHLNKSGAALVISAPRRGLTQDYLGAIHFRTHKDDLRRVGLKSPVVDKITGEALSAAIVPEKDLFVVTHPTPGLVTCWTLSTLELQKTINLPRVRGVALTDDRQELVFAYGPQANIARFAVSTLEPVGSQSPTPTLISGSHMMNWSVI